MIGTMNTADRSIALVDAALRRRFYFKGFVPTEEPVASVLVHWLSQNGLDELPARLLTVLNEEIGRDELSVGPSYFITRDGSAPDLERVWRYAILPLLEEYYYGTGRDVPKEFSLNRLLGRITGGAVDEPTAAADGSGQGVPAQATVTPVLPTLSEVDFPE